MRILLAVSLVLAACSGSPKKTVAQDTAADTAAESCCCKSNPQTSEDGKPVYEVGNRMECSTKQGECVDDVQCANQEQPE